MKKILFLFGSGISIPAGFPNTNDITTSVLNSNCGSSWSLLPLLEDLYECCKKYYDQNITPNYEHLFSLVNQLYDSEIKEYENPGLTPYLQILKRKYCKNDSSKFYRKLDDLSRYIKIKVAECFIPPKNDPKYLSILNNLHEKNELTIFTLNHDTLIENYFENNKIMYNDGFTEIDQNTKIFQPNQLDKKNKGIRFFKLHGSINWFYWSNDDEKSLNSKITKRCISDEFTGKKSTPNTYDDIPIFLVGTYDKILIYSKIIFAELFYRLHAEMKKCQNIILPGYGFGDKGINDRLIYWKNESSKNRLILIHPKDKDPYEGAR